MGRPVVVSDLGAGPDAVLAPPAVPEDRMTGLRFSSGDDAALAAALIRLFSGRPVPVVIAQSWLEDPEFRFDLNDPQARQRELRIKVRRNGHVFDGSAWRHGRRHWVRCRES